MATLDYAGLSTFKGLVEGEINQSIAPEYSTSATYAVGDPVMYKGQLYRCKVAIATAEAWTAAHWEASKTAVEISALKEDLNAIGLSVVDGKLCVTYEEGA